MRTCSHGSSRKSLAIPVSEANDVLNLATHLKNKRDYFVTTDKKILDASDRLKALGIHVVTPDDAAALARALSQGARLRASESSV
jgi:hypothetical protein